MKAVLVEDQPLLLELLRDALAARGVQVVAGAHDEDAAVVAVARTAPDVVVLDLRLGPTSEDGGVRVAERVRRDHPDVALLALSAHVDGGHARRLLELDRPARKVGYLLKDRVADVDRLVDAMRRVVDGEVVVDPAVLDRLLAARDGDERLAALTAHERRILGLLADGLSNQGIAERLGSRVTTVEKHLSVITRKLGLPAGEDAARSAVNVRVLAALAWLDAARTG